MKDWGCNYGWKWENKKKEKLKIMIRYKIPDEEIKEKVLILTTDEVVIFNKAFSGILDEIVKIYQKHNNIRIKLGKDSNAKTN